jgi:hypothetical protein
MISHDDRGVTSPLEYVYTFALATILITGLIIAATNAAGDQRRRTADAQMEVVAQQVAGNLEAADRLLESAAGAPDLRLERKLPDTLLGSGYTVTIGTGSNPTVAVTSSLTDRTVTATAELSATQIGTEQVFQGGEIEIVYGSFASGSNLEVNDV